MAVHHEHRPHLVLLMLADLFLLGSSLFTHNRNAMFAIALMTCIVLDLTYLFIWKRVARH